MVQKPDNKTSPAGQASQTYTIAELAREFDITNRAIRFYEDQGLLYPARNGQQRIYSPRDRTLLKLILRGKRLGFSLAESKKLFDLYDPDTDNKTQLENMVVMIDEKMSSLNQQLKDIEIMALELKEAKKRCVTAMLDSDISPMPGVKN